MLDFVKEYYVKSTDREWKTTFDKKIENNLSKAYKKRVVENIKYLKSIGLDDKRIATILVRAPELFLLEPNPANNNSLDVKLKFFEKYGLKPASSLLVAHKLYEYELYDESNARKVIISIENKIQDNATVGKILYKYPNVLSISSDEIEKRLDFWRTQSEFVFKDKPNPAHTVYDKNHKIVSTENYTTEEGLRAFISRWPGLLHYSVDQENSKSIQSKLAFYKKRFKLSDAELVSQIYSFPIFVGLDINPEKKGSVQVKISKLNELGFGDITIGQNLKVLAAPVNKVKARYIICRNFGLSREVFLNGKFMIHEQKLYARARFLHDHPRYPRSLLYATESEFYKRTGRSCYHDHEVNGFVYKSLVSEYPLNEEAMRAEQEKFNLNRKNLVELNQEEIKAVAGNNNGEAEEAQEYYTYTYLINDYNSTEWTYDISGYEKE
ncbi:MAG: hypothetical protein IJ542_00430 [Clostridia bacterium]|nr:hypothetical protein [Clostridia bacterium]